MTKLMLLQITTVASSTGTSVDDPMGDLVGIIMWIARVLLIVIGGGYGVYSIVRSQTDENPKQFAEGVTSIIAAAVLFAASFAVEAVFS